MSDTAKHAGFMALLFVIIMLIFNLPLWRDADGATQTLTEAGYQDIEILPNKFMSHCGRIGPFITYFKATTTKGDPVSGKVCHSFFGNPYIRLDKKAKMEQELQRETEDAKQKSPTP